MGIFWSSPRHFFSCGDNINCTLIEWTSFATQRITNSLRSGKIFSTEWSKQSLLPKGVHFPILLFYADNGSIQSKILSLLEHERYEAVVDDRGRISRCWLYMMALELQMTPCRIVSTVTESHQCILFRIESYLQFVSRYMPGYSFYVLKDERII